jgi:hypothetical protein
VRLISKNPHLSHCRFSAWDKPFRHAVEWARKSIAIRPNEGGGSTTCQREGAVGDDEKIRSTQLNLPPRISAHSSLARKGKARGNGGRSTGTRMSRNVKSSSKCECRLSERGQRPRTICATYDELATLADVETCRLRPDPGDCNDKGDCNDYSATDGT